MIVAEQAIWGDLMRVDEKYRSLVWRDDIANRVGGDPRGNYPARYMAMCGNLKPFGEYPQDMAIADLTPTSANKFVATEGEITGAKGLFRLVDQFPIEISPVGEIILVGAISQNSLFALLAWCQQHDMDTAHITLVDRSPIPLETIRLMQEGGYFNWPGGIDLVEGDITTYKPPQKPDIIFGDILSSWMVAPYNMPLMDECPPYQNYETFLQWAAEQVGDQGWFFSRCMIAPDQPVPTDPNLRMVVTAPERADRILEQLGPLAERIDRAELEDDVARLFNNPTPACCCGLDAVHPWYKQERPLTGASAELAIKGLYGTNFGTNHMITVHDPHTGYNFLNFASQLAA